MTSDNRFSADPVLARVAAVSPRIDEADLSPTGERAIAILDRVLASPPAEADAGRERSRARAWRPRWRLRGPAVGGFALALAAAVVALVFLNLGGSTRRSSPPLGTHPVPTADQIHLHPAKIPHEDLVILDRTPIGRAIAQQSVQTQLTLDTGDAAQNRRALQELQFNEAACTHAAAVVAATQVTLGQRYIRYDWVQGTRLEKRLDEEYVTALRDFAGGDRAAGERVMNDAGRTLTFEVDSFTSFAFNSLTGDAGPLPRVPGIEGRGGRRLPPDTKMP